MNDGKHLVSTTKVVYLSCHTEPIGSFFKILFSVSYTFSLVGQSQVVYIRPGRRVGRSVESGDGKLKKGNGAH